MEKWNDKPQQRIVNAIANRVREKFSGEGSGHDWWHIHRVRNLAVHIAEKEGADKFVVELSALLHDVADHKLHGGDVAAGLKLIQSWLNSEQVSADVIEKVLFIAKHISYKGAAVEDVPLDLEGQVVRDADRLDAIGAVGIARTFAFGGNRNRLMYDPSIPPEMHDNFEAYKSTDAPTINHFYEKLLLLKDRMHTKTARQMAIERHQYMEQYLKQFFAEWAGER